MQENNERLAGAGVAWRRPGEATYCAIWREPVTLGSLKEAGSRAGFVFAPFDTEGKTPTLFFSGAAERLALPAETPDAPISQESSVAKRGDDFAAEFVAAHALVEGGSLAKMVLSGHEDLGADLRGKAWQMFLRACKMYPDAFVALVRPSGGEAWLMATPELLLRGRGWTVETMALAGTRPSGSPGSWDDKNRREHEVVCQFVGERLRAVADEVRNDETTTLRAGGLSHLMTRFAARLREGRTAWDAALALHPTPAMCGTPQKEAKAAILGIEKTAREYFSGIAGAAWGDGDTDLYVSIRCMKMTEGRTRLFSGVGLMPDSEVESETLEAAAKRGTMKRVIFKDIDPINVF